ncbi:Unc-112-related protein [Frankliniella fusca]|uniref:Unc-112-related protein n=1 Tax=Frankliniella fusca TaxID=407009 RepID=A0AAE1LXT6_9NEOP|nr:Unc-112-related protein [Frankliniella fusca]
MMSEGYLVGDGSWNLRVFVTDLQVERSLRVKGDLHIGGVMLRLVEDLGNTLLPRLSSAQSPRDGGDTCGRSCPTSRSLSRWTLVGRKAARRRRVIVGF